MKKKRKLIYFITIFVAILIIGCLVINTIWWLSVPNRTYIETIESNWDITLPNPIDEKELLYNRGWMGDGEAITELVYEQPLDILEIQDLNPRLVKDKKVNIEALPSWVQNLVNAENIDDSATYFYLKKDSYDYIVFKLNGNKLTIYEFYQ